MVRLDLPAYLILPLLHFDRTFRVPGEIHKEIEIRTNRAIPEQTRAIAKLCLLTETFYPNIGDGTAVHAYQLARSLSLKGVQVFVITRQTQPLSPSLERVDNILIRRILPQGRLKGKGWRALVPILVFLARVLYLLVKNTGRYDGILVFGIKVLTMPALLAKLLLRKKCVIRSESPLELKEDISTESLRNMGLARLGLLLRPIKSVRNRILKRADCFVAISSEIRQELVKLSWNRQKIRLIPNGIETTLFRPASVVEKLQRREQLLLPSNKNLFIYSGRLALSKGVLLLAQVWKELVRDHPDIHLVLVGSGSGVLSFDGCESELVSYLRDNKLQSSVTLTGQVANVHEYLQAADIFVFPSDYEGFGLAIVEALACGLPAVVTDVGVAREEIQDYRNGILVPTKDPAKLKRAMQWMLGHRDAWAQMGSNARSGIEKYSTTVEAEKYLGVFAELGLNERGRLSKPSPQIAGNAG